MEDIAIDSPPDFCSRPLNADRLSAYLQANPAG
jgi:hypothetical protein